MVQDRNSSWGGKGSLEIINPAPLAQSRKTGRVLRGTSRWILRISEDGDSTATLGYFFQCSITLAVKKAVHLSVFIASCLGRGHHWHESAFVYQSLSSPINTTSMIPLEFFARWAVSALSTSSDVTDAPNLLTNTVYGLCSRCSSMSMSVDILLYQHTVSDGA